MLRKSLLCLVLLLIGTMRLPAQTPPAAPAPPQDFAITVPFAATTAPISLIVVNVKVNGKGPYLFLLDTGASSSLIDSGLAAELGIKAAAPHKFKGGNGKIATAGTAHLETVEMGEMRLEHLPCFIAPMPAGISIRGLLGYDVFDRYVVTVDYSQKSVTFSAPGTFHYSGSGFAVPLEFDSGGGRPVIARDMDGIPARFVIDTGDDGALNLYGAFVTANHLMNKYASHLRKEGIETMTGLETSALTIIPALTLGANALKQVPTKLIAPTDTTLGEQDGDIGGEILCKFTVTFDYTHRRAYFAPNANYADAYSRNRAGFVPHYEKAGWTVRLVEEHSPTAAAGLKVGDRITKIDGKDAAQADFLQFRGLTYQPAGTELRLTVQSGKKTREVTLILKDYD